MYNSTAKTHSSSKKKVQEEESTITDNFHEYLMNSTLHGLKYIGDKNITIFERTFFVLAVIIVSILSGYFISNVWQKWSETPIIIGLNPLAVPLSAIPFPAVTICNMNQARLSKASRVVKGSLEDLLLDSMCGFNKEFMSPNNNTGKWMHFKQFIESASQPCRDMLVMCRYASKVEQCMDIFWTSLTDEGLCCTFNTVHPDFMFHTALSENKWDVDINNSKGYAIDWTPEEGYPENVPKNAFPRQTAGAGSNVGLTVALNCNKANYFCSSTSSYGFKVLLHTPTETPKINNYGFYVAPGKETRVVVTPKIYEASQLIRKIPVQQRQCVFASERNLSYFRTYTQKNCEMECESMVIAKHCGCILYYMPKTSTEQQICSLKDAECYESIKTAVKVNASLTCSCLPACYEIDYGRDSSSSPLGIGYFLTKETTLKKYSYDYVRDNIALLHIFFVENSIHSYTKSEFIGFTDFLSSTGGLLGLFLGFSVVSLIEIIYYISMRPYCMKRKQQVQAAPKILPVLEAWTGGSTFRPGGKRNFRRRKIGMHFYPYCE
ncbi:Pickpocket protein 28 [Sergentomyia squamirostris]